MTDPSISVTETIAKILGALVRLETLDTLNASEVRARAAVTQAEKELIEVREELADARADVKTARDDALAIRLEAEREAERIIDTARKANARE